MIQVLLYLSPVIYPLGMLPPFYRSLLSLNPMAGLIEGFRSSVLGTPWDFPSLAVSTAVTFALFTAGLFYFRKVERRFADFA
jgi:lipopolysaccharide transport system permease protein